MLCRWTKGEDRKPAQNSWMAVPLYLQQPAHGMPGLRSDLQANGESTWQLHIQSWFEAINLQVPAWHHAGAIEGKKKIKQFFHPGDSFFRVSDITELKPTLPFQAFSPSIKYRPRYPRQRLLSFKKKLTTLNTSLHPCKISEANTKHVMALSLWRPWRTSGLKHRNHLA